MEDIFEQLQNIRWQVEKDLIKGRKDMKKNKELLKIIKVVYEKSAQCFSHHTNYHAECKL